MTTWRRFPGFHQMREMRGRQPSLAAMRTRPALGHTAALAALAIAAGCASAPPEPGEAQGPAAPAGPEGGIAAADTAETGRDTTLFGIPLPADRGRAARGLVVGYPVYEPVEPPRGYLMAVESGTRTETGRPGPDYWQQRVDYRIDVTLDPAAARLSGEETITIHNNSPDTLQRVVLRLYQNVFTPGAPRNRSIEVTGGVDLLSVAVAGEPIEQLTERALGTQLRADAAARAGGYAVNGTIATVMLPRPFPPGGALELDIGWEIEVPGADAFRMGHLGFHVFNLAQWYPQVAVYDDVYGWDESPYLGDGEFYLEYGSFDVRVALPEGWLVGATGDLVNAEEVLPPGAIERLRAAASADTIVHVVSAADLEAGRVTVDAAGDRLTWHFRADSVRDFAFAASDRYVWDATGADRGAAAAEMSSAASADAAANDVDDPAAADADDPGGDASTAPARPEGRVLIQAFYDPAIRHWREAAGFAQFSIDFFGDYIMPYAYPQATVAYGPPWVGGMEYPMITFIAESSPGVPLFSVIAHELGHFWFPMVIGSKENAFAWMDEGLTTFDESLARASMYGEETARFHDMASYLRAAVLGIEVPIMRHTDYVEAGLERGVAAYSKPATLLHSLRHMIGEEAFDAGYSAYARAWSFRHPLPWDFFNMMEEAAGEDLDWFWQPWFYQTATLDQAIRSVDPTPGGVRITVANLDDAVMPVELELEFDTGETTTLTWPVDIWVGTREVTRTLAVSGPVERITIDPGMYYPDIDRSNNTWEARPQ